MLSAKMLGRSVVRSARTMTYAPLFARARSTSAKALGLPIASPGVVHHNLTYKEILEHEIKNEEGVMADNGTFAVSTGASKGRSPEAKYIVKQEPSQGNIWWGDVNHPCSPEVFGDLKVLVDKFYADQEEVYVFDGWCGSNPSSQRAVRFVTTMAWHHHFVRNMFIRPEEGEIGDDFEPEFTIVNAGHITNPDWEKHGLANEKFIAFNLEKQLALIGGTLYGGEMKKGIFSMMNYWLPMDGIMAMHCSANIGKDGDTCLFFGLSGTGKTTLSADEDRDLIGDDEHGWDDDGIFNFEGGCYAKTVGLSMETEPMIFQAIRENALLENVVMDDAGHCDYDDISITQNGRVSYPLFHIDNFAKPSMGGHPANIIFLTCDAEGVLPPVSRLSEEQAMYHFLSGYTSKVPGTTNDADVPTPTFSPCFGSAFLPLHPTAYAKLLAKKMQKHGTKAFLVNTGWSGGSWKEKGNDARMKLSTTRSIIKHIFSGEINDADFETHELFQLDFPTNLPGVPDGVLNPRDAWEDKESYDENAQKLAQAMIDNYEKNVAAGSDTDFSVYGPKV